MTTDCPRQRCVARTTVIEAPPAAVFDAVNSPAIALLIDPGVRMWRPDTDPIGVGTRFTIRGKLGLLPIRGISETITWDPPYQAVYHSVKPSWPMRMVAEHTFEPDGELRTRYTWSLTFIERNPIARPMIAIAARLFRKAMANQATALSAYFINSDSDGSPSYEGDPG